MRTTLLEQAIEESKRNKIRESLPKETREKINSLFSQMDDIWWVIVAPKLHALYLSIFGVTAFFMYDEILQINLNIFLEIVLLAILQFLFFKVSMEFANAIFYRKKSILLSSIIEQLNQDTDLREALWLIRAKSHPRDRRIATIIMQKLLKEEEEL
jgi:membrane glycosyltransferase